MKKLHLLCVVLISLLISGSAFAQNQNQNQNHPTIDKIKVGYKPVPVVTSTSTPSGKPQMSVNPEVMVSLKTTTNIAKIYLKIADKTSDNVIYQVNYNISSPPIIGDKGTKLFYKDNLVIHITNPNMMQLDTYKYKLITEDGQGNQTVEFIAIQ